MKHTHLMRQALGYIVSFLFILGALLLGNWFQQLLGTSVPGSIIGMLLLFSAMASGILPVKWVQPSARLIIRYMILLFVPISVGLMQHFDLLLNNALPILASTIGGTLIVLVTLSLILDKILSKGEQ